MRDPATAFDAGGIRAEDAPLAAVRSIMAPLSIDFWKFAATAEVPQLGPGPRRDVLERAPLESLVDQFSAAHDLPSDAAVLLRAVLLLYHDHHDPAHDLVQDLSDRDGALIHAILHRREPDYWNAKYWFRRVDMHPVYLALGRRLSSLTSSEDHQPLVRKLTLPGAFDPFAFVDLAEQLERQSEENPTVRWLRQIQHAEFEELVSHLLAS